MWQENNTESEDFKDTSRKRRILQKSSGNISPTILNKCQIINELSEWKCFFTPFCNIPQWVQRMDFKGNKGIKKDNADEVKWVIFQIPWWDSYLINDVSVLPVYLYICVTYGCLQILANRDQFNQESPNILPLQSYKTFPQRLTVQYTYINITMSPMHGQKWLFVTITTYYQQCNFNPGFADLRC